MARIFVTGAAGFIGSNAVDHLLSIGHSVTGWDNFSTGFESFLSAALASSKFTLTRGDNLDRQALTHAMAGHDEVWHLAANADVRHGVEHPEKDLEQNTIATFHVLEAMRANGIKKILFSSTGSVYGASTTIPTPEDAPFPIQTSLYGASKAAGEGLLQAYAEGYGFRSYIFRFVSILGERYTHGHIFDFYRQLRADPSRLKVLGDGKQRKSYLYVQDCIRAMLLASSTNAEKSGSVYNLGVDSYCSVTDSIAWICEELAITPTLEFTGGPQGWIGDNPFIYLKTDRIRQMGWRPELTIREGVISTLRWLVKNPWVLERR